MNEDKEVKVVVRKLDAGLAKPIDISTEDAINIAREQNANNHEADIQIEETKDIDTVIEQAKVDTTVNTITNDANLYNQEVNLEKLNEVNDLVKVEKVKKENPKVILAMLFVLAAIILGFFIFELPMIIETFK